MWGTPSPRSPVAETGADTSRFATPGHLTPWAGMCPGHHESAGKKKSGKTRHPNHWLGAALGTAAMAATRTRDTTYPGARYRRLVPRLGKTKALVALQHPILTALWHILTHDTDYHDLGGDYFTRRDPQAAMRRITRQANALGFTIRFDPIQAPRSRSPPHQHAHTHHGTSGSPIILGPARHDDV